MTNTDNFLKKLSSRHGLFVSIWKSEKENAEIIKFLLDQFLAETQLMASERTRDNWQKISELPTNFACYRFKLA